jgi:glutamate-1-semialdehyde 2,1-aminomutase
MDQRIRTAHSQKYFDEARKVLVGGVNSPVRSFRAVGGQPLVMKYGEHQKIFDYDNNAFTDYCLSWGALILGHAPRNVVLAAKKTAEKGISFGTTTREEIELAKLIQERVPSIDLIRFVNSGTEATMSAIRLARGFTKKEMIVKFDGCYHGHADDLLTKAGSGVAELPQSSSLGIPQSHINNTLSLPYNDIEALEKTFNQYKDRIACVIIEPVAGNMGTIPAKMGFLKALREMTKKDNVVLIFDEIITGFRTHPGCLQSEWNIIPDITCLGKIIGGGFPVGAYGGRKDIMNCLSPLGDVYQAGTFSGNPVVMRSGTATLRLLDKSFYKSLNERSEVFAQDLNIFFIKNNINAHLSYYKSMMSLRFRKEAVENYEDAQKAESSSRYAELFNDFLQQWIYFPPADLETFFISGMHTRKDLTQLSEHLKTFFKKGE